MTCVEVSIGMPVYNGEAFIRDALNTLLAQSFSDFELIISDNASFDGTENVCREVSARDRRVRYVRQEKNFGAFANFGFVLKEAKGKYFMWAAADDRWSPSFIAKLQSAHSQKNVVLAMTRYHNCSRRWAWVRTHRIPTIDGISNLLREERLKSFWGVPWGYTKANFFYGLWKRDLLLELWQETSGNYRGSEPIAFDFNLLSRALIKGQFFQVDEPLFEKMHKSTPCGHIFENLMAALRHPAEFCRPTNIESTYVGALSPLFVEYPSLSHLVRSDFQRNANGVSRALLSLRYGIFCRKGIVPKT